MKENELSSRLLKTYWIPIQVRKADSIEIYTKSGTDSERTNADKTTTHVLHWGVDHTVWDPDERVRLLVPGLRRCLFVWLQTTDVFFTMKTILKAR